MYKADRVNFKDGEILAWRNGDTRYAILKRNGQFYDQAGRIIDRSSTLKAAIDAAMR